MDRSPAFSGDYCAVCGGWGFAPPTSSKKCTTCNGYGVKIIRNNRYFFSKLPLVVDFGKRDNLKLTKKILLSVALVIMAVFVGLLVLMFTYGFS